MGTPGSQLTWSVLAEAFMTGRGWDLEGRFLVLHVSPCTGWHGTGELSQASHAAYICLNLSHVAFLRDGNSNNSMMIKHPRKQSLPTTILAMKNILMRPHWLLVRRDSNNDAGKRVSFDVTFYFDIYGNVVCYLTHVRMITDYSPDISFSSSIACFLDHEHILSWKP